MIGQKVGKSSYMANVPPTARRVLDTVGAASFILFLIAGNLAGYAVGGSGVGVMLAKLCTKEGAATVFWSFYILCSGACIMNFLKEKHIST